MPSPKEVVANLLAICDDDMEIDFNGLYGIPAPWDADLTVLHHDPTEFVRHYIPFLNDLGLGYPYADIDRCGKPVELFLAYWAEAPGTHDPAIGEVDAAVGLSAELDNVTPDDPLPDCRSNPSLCTCGRWVSDPQDPTRFVDAWASAPDLPEEEEEEEESFEDVLYRLTGIEPPRGYGSPVERSVSTDAEDREIRLLRRQAMELIWSAGDEGKWKEVVDRYTLGWVPLDDRLFSRLREFPEGRRALERFEDPNQTPDIDDVLAIEEAYTKWVRTRDIAYPLVLGRRDKSPSRALCWQLLRELVIPPGVVEFDDLPENVQQIIGGPERLPAIFRRLFDF